MEKYIISFGVFPPPTSGQTVSFEKFTRFLSEHFTIIKLDISPKIKNRNFIFKLIKTQKWFKSIFILLKYSFKGNLIYLSYDSGRGFYLDFLTQVIGKSLGYKFVIHHHSYSYINKKQFLYKFITNMIREDSIHIFLCQKMMTSYKEQYGKIKGMVLNNWFFLDLDLDKIKVRKKNSSKLILGILSNLTIEKGLTKTIEVAKELKKRGLNIELYLAGPIIGEKEEEIKNKIIKDGNNQFIKFLGPVYGEEKNNLLNEIDIFLFPTNYKNEAMPLVLLEALKEQCYIISAERGCIKEVLSKYNCIINDIDRYVENTVSQILSLDKSFIREKVTFNIKKIEKDLIFTSQQLDNILFEIKELLK